MADAQTVVKFITKERFLKAKANGNYGDVSDVANAIIDAANPLDVLELRLKEGSAYNVLTASKLTQERYFELLKGA